MQIILGIDVGVTGAIAAIDADGQYRGIEDLRVCRDKSTAWIDGPELVSSLQRLTGGATARAFIERLGAMPKSKGGQEFGGAHTAIVRGLVLGSVLASIQIAGIGGELITSVQWKRALGLPKEKHASLDKARMLYPRARGKLDRKCDHNRAEALLIAHFGHRFRLNRKAA